jgi:prepilin-type processing-associated H-X9-DG protein
VFDTKIQVRAPAGAILLCGTLFLVDLASRKDQIFCLHFADANEPEIVGNGAILSRIEEMIGFSTLRDLEKHVHMFIDTIVEGRKPLRLEDRGEIVEVDGPDFPLRQLLTHIPIQGWPFPHSRYCPCAFCDGHGDRDALESHMEDEHLSIVRMDGYHSEVQLGLAGLLGVTLRVNKRKRWKSPFGYCAANFDRYSAVADHVLNTRAHMNYEKYFYTEVGGFWAPIFAHLNSKREWPTVHQIFHNDQAEAQIEVIPMTREIANETWRTSCKKHTAEDIGHIRLMQGRQWKKYSTS